MVLPETALEPVLVELFSDESVQGDTCSEKSGIDALWFEVGELLEEMPLADLDQAFDSGIQKNEKKRARSTQPSGTKRSKESSVTPSAVKEAKFADEDDIKREIRMARNRASAERTRLKRLEHIKSLETQVLDVEARNEALIRLLQSSFNKSEKDVDIELPEGFIAVPPAEPTRRTRAKKGDAKDLLKKLEQESDRLSPEEVAQLRKEARMARNRASAERTRLRRLEAARQLEVRVNIAKFKFGKLSEMLRDCAFSLSSSERSQLNVDQLLEPLDSRQQTPDTVSYDSGSTCCSSGDEGDAISCFEHEVARHERLCETRPAWSVLYPRLLYSPLLKLLVTRKASVCNGLVVSKQEGWNSKSLSVKVGVCHQVARLVQKFFRSGPVVVSFPRVSSLSRLSMNQRATIQVCNKVHSNVILP